MKTKTIIGLTLFLFCLMGMNEQSYSRTKHSKIDQVTLFNGDRVTGEVRRLFGGLLELKTSTMGTIKIEWQEIARLESPYHYEVRMSDGTRFYGSLDGESRPGELALTDIYGEHMLNTLEIVEIRPVERTFLDRISVRLSAGYSYTRASEVMQTSFDANVDYETEAGSTNFSARTTVTDTDTDSTSSTRVDLGRQLWTGREQWFRTFFTNYEDNDELNLNHRVGVGYGYGRHVVNTQRMRLTGTTGLQATTERGSGSSSEEQQNLELFIDGKFSAWRFETPELALDFGLTLYPSITESGRLRSDLSLRLSWEMIKDLTWDISGWASYDNKSDSSIDLDYALTTGIGWKY